MTTDFHDAVFDAIVAELRSEEQQPASAAPRSVWRPVAVATAAAVVVGGAGAAWWVARGSNDGPVRLTIGPADGTTGATTTTQVPADVVDPSLHYVGLATPHGPMYRVPSDDPVAVLADSMNGPLPERGPDDYGFRLAGSDPRLQGMSLTKVTDERMAAEPREPVERIGERLLEQPAGIQEPAGMTDANRTGPYLFTETDGTSWMIFGRLVELREALPRVTYRDGRMVLGEGLAEWTPRRMATKRLFQLRDERIELMATRDTESDLTLVDPVAGDIEAVDIGGRPGIISTGLSLRWRLDDDTVLTVQRSLASFGGPAPTKDDLVAAARDVVPFTVDQVRALPVWRGELHERVVVKVPAGTDLGSSEGNLAGNGDGVQMEDLDGGRPAMTAAVDITWMRRGHALPVDASQVGHRLRLTLRPNGAEAPSGPPEPCAREVVVPGDGEPPVEVTLDRC